MDGEVVACAMFSRTRCVLCCRVPVSGESVGEVGASKRAPGAATHGYATHVFPVVAAHCGTAETSEEVIASPWFRRAGGPGEVEVCLRDR